MASFLVLYGTGEGQTAQVADRIVQALTDRGHEATPVNVEELSPAVSVDDFDAVLVGASIHAGKHQSAVREFVREHRELLKERPTAFFQVSLSSAEERAQARAAEYVEGFVEDTGWYPDRIGLFGGALRFSEYGFLKRLMIKQIVKRSMPETDTTRDVEFTDWDEVEAFAADVAAFVENRIRRYPARNGHRAGR